MALSGMFTLPQQQQLVGSSKWTNPVISGFNQVGAVGTSGVDWSLGYAGGTLFAARLTTSPNGSTVIHKSTDSGATWTQGATLTGSGSSYGQGMLVISSSILIVQNRGYFYRSTDGGSNFSTILTTSGGQNNFHSISSDGTYGVCGGYDRNVVTTDNWVSASAVSSPYPYCLSTCALTNNGGNKFVHAGLGSSNSPAAAYIAGYNGSTIATISLNANGTLIASNPATGFNAIAAKPENNSSFTIRYATYPSTSYTVADVTGMGITWSGYPCVSPSGHFIMPMTSGLWKINPGAAPTQISNLTDIIAVCSDGSNYVYALRMGGQVYRWAP